MKSGQRFRHRFVAITSSLFAAGLLAGCRTIDLSGTVPTVAFQGINVQNVEADPAAHLQLDVALRFKVTNPLDVPLVIPQHQVKLQLDGQEVNGLTAGVTQFLVPPHGASNAVYTFHFDLGAAELAGYLGHEVPYTLSAEVKPLSFANVTLKLEHSDTLRLPLLPTFAPSGAATVGFLGNHAVETVDLTPIRDGMAGFVDGLMNPPNPSFPPGNHLVSDAMNKVIGAIGGDKWDEFKKQWDKFKNRSVKFSVPNANLEGLQVTVPFQVTNPNYFPIEVPVFAVGAGVDPANQFTSTRILPHGASPTAPLDASARTLAARSSKEMNVVVTLRWRDLGSTMDFPGLLGLDSHWQLPITFSGETLFDLGYGPTRIKLNMPVTLKQPGI